MLTKRQNLLETIRGGNPDRYVNQFEALAIVGNPYSATNPAPKPGEVNIVNAWGVTRSWPAGTPGPFPVHTGDKIVCPDVTEWKEKVHAPNVVFSDEDWAPFVAQAEKVDRNEQFVTHYVAPGVFEQCHYLMEIQNCLINFYEEPEAMHELIDYITEWELKYAEEVCKHLKPDALFHHDDWGTQMSTFLSPAMFEEFYLPAYKKIYGYYKEHGVQVIIHHSRLLRRDPGALHDRNGHRYLAGRYALQQYPRADPEVRRPDHLYGRRGQRPGRLSRLDPRRSGEGGPLHLRSLRHQVLHPQHLPGRRHEHLPRRL